MKPRPFFFAHVMGIRAYMLGRSILMKAVGMWHWEVKQPFLTIGTLLRRGKNSSEATPFFGICCGHPGVHAGPVHTHEGCRHVALGGKALSRHSLLAIRTLLRKYRRIYVKAGRSSLHMPWASERTCWAALSS